MSQTSDFDIGPLTWVKSEIDAALDRARECIQKALSGSEKREQLRFAQTHVHQASGALSVVGLDGVSQYADAIDKLLHAAVASEADPSDTQLDLAGRGIAVLANYINELLAGAPHQPLRLFESFREMVVARGAEAPQPSELFFPDLGVRPALGQGRSVEPERLAHELRVMRGRFEKGLLAWIRQPQSSVGPEEMLKAVRFIEQMQALPATRAFWWAAIAFFEGLAAGAIPADRQSHRLCRRIDTQMRRLIEGSSVVAERLVRDVLYYVATARIESEHARSVRQVYRLETLLPSPDAHLSDTLRQPLALRLREALEQAKEYWNRFIAGAAVALPQFIEQHAELVARAAPMHIPQVDRLLGSMGSLLEWLRADPLRANEMLAMEVATGLLVVEQANESPNSDPALLRKQVDLLMERYAARVAGHKLAELDDTVFGEASRRAQERLFFNQLAREILTNLGQIEQTLDAFFRNPAQREPLNGLTGPLKQIEGAFSMLGEARGAQLVRDSAARVAAFASQTEPPSQDECNDVAHQLSALGFYVEALKTGPAKLEHFLDPSLVKVSDSEVEAVTDTVEAQIARDTRGTQELVDALKEAPEDKFLRQQLVSNLEALREDAHLIADTELEQQAKDAIASLKAGGEDAAGRIEEALAAVAPVAAPQPSAEAARLMQVSSEELDSELLEIFLEEADEVVATITEHRAIVAAEPYNVDALTTLRRSFHTLKGSSRMVGLQEFSEAARHVEMAMNRWLQLEKDASGEIISLIDHGRETFAAWVAQLHAGQGAWRDASDLIRHADELLAALDVPSDEDSIVSAAPVVARAAASAPTPTPAEMPAPAAGNTPASGAASEQLIEASLSETTFDLGAFDLPGLAPSEPHFESSLEETRLDMPSLESLGLGLDVEPMEVDTTPDVEQDLVGTQINAMPAPDMAQPAAAEPLIESSLAETTFDFDALDLPELGRDASAFQTMPVEPVAGSAGVDLDLVLDADDEPAAEMAASVMSGAAAQEAEMDLTSSLVGSELRDLEAAEAGHAEIDLTDTSLDGRMFSGLGEDGTDTSLDAVTLDDIVSPFDIATEAGTASDLPLAEADEDDGSLTLADIEARDPGVAAMEAMPAAMPTEVPAPAPVPVSLDADGLQEVSIEDVDGDDDLPHLNLNALGTSVPADSVAARVAELAELAEPPVASPDESVSDDVTFGASTISRGLFELYVGEAAQHLATLRHEVRRLQSSPLAVPEAVGVRAAHTLAGISGTARIEPVQAVAKALEHALHHFCDVERAPDANQTAVMDTAVSTLDAMLGEVQRMQLPLEVPELVSQLDSLRPSFESTSLAAVMPVIDTATPVASADDEPAQGVEAMVVSDEAASIEAPATDEEEEEAGGVQDDLDEQLLPIFFEEAEELSAEIGGVLRDLRADAADQNALKSLARLLHTYKGSARMAGAMRLGELVHGLETHLESALHAQQAGPDLVDRLENGLDNAGALLAGLRDPAKAAPVPQAPAAATPQAAPAAGSAPAPAPAGAPAATAVPMAAVLPEEGDVVAGQRALLRVRADLVDRFVNEAGEISIARTRVEGEMRTLRRSLLDLTENVIRLRNQLREVEIQAESQMQSRIATAGAEIADFDPLEFDRFTRFQEVTRMMAESVGDVTTIQQNLLRNLDAADTALHAQGRLSRDLQQALMTVRMVPFDELADRLHRVVRQTAKELGKRANLDISGGRIEIDRSVLDRMTAPIEHLLRNSLAHGIEMPDVRKQAGKPELGQITITLTQRSNEILLELSDDGRGLNFERIQARGREAGLIDADETPSESRLTQLIFEPGFSTAESVSGVAGRGVGMDVVKNEAMSVGGRIDVFSEAGKGARFLVHLPLTLAVTQALLVRAGERTYAIPSNMVVQATELKEPALIETRERGYAVWKDVQYPFRYLPRLLGDTTTQPAQGRFHWVLLLAAGNQTLGLHIDELRGNQEIVVKNAGPQFVRLQGYTGATVLPDGEISLILNPVVLAGRKQHVEEDADAIAPVADTFEVPTVMVVDDSLTVRKITSRLLEREGFRVVTAKDGVDALEQLVDVKPDVMLLDIEMPRMDGFDLARNIRADEKLRDLPLIMITSRTAEKHRNYAREIGVDHYLGKPYQEEQLLELITSFIAARRR